MSNSLQDTLRRRISGMLNAYRGVSCAVDVDFRLAQISDPVEEHIIRAACASVKTQFRSGRAVARLALAGVPGGEEMSHRTIPRGKHGAPLWPSGLIGSISHCRDCAIAVAARQNDTRRLGIGVDIENCGRVQPGILNYILTSKENAILKTLGNELHWAQIVFSAKEAFYKAVYPALGRVLDFPDAEIEISGDSDMWEGRLNVTPAPWVKVEVDGDFRGSWICDGQHVVTFVERLRHAHVV